MDPQIDLSSLSSPSANANPMPDELLPFEDASEQKGQQPISLDAGGALSPRLQRLDLPSADQTLASTIDQAMSLYDSPVAGGRDPMDTGRDTFLESLEAQREIAADVKLEHDGTPEMNSAIKQFSEKPVSKIDTDIKKMTGDEYVEKLGEAKATGKYTFMDKPLKNAYSLSQGILDVMPQFKDHVERIWAAAKERGTEADQKLNMDLWNLKLYADARVKYEEYRNPTDVKFDSALERIGVSIGAGLYHVIEKPFQAIEGSAIMLGFDADTRATMADLTDFVHGSDDSVFNKHERKLAAEGWSNPVSYALYNILDLGAQMGTQYLYSTVGRSIGAIGGLFGGGAAGAETGPGALATASTGAIIGQKVGEHAAGMFASMSLEAQSARRSMLQMGTLTGLDATMVEEKATEYARYYGAVAGVLEYGAMIGHLSGKPGKLLNPSSWGKDLKISMFKQMIESTQKLGGKELVKKWGLESLEEGVTETLQGGMEKYFQYKFLSDLSGGNKEQADQWMRDFNGVGPDENLVVSLAMDALSQGGMGLFLGGMGAPMIRGTMRALNSGLGGPDNPQVFYDRNQMQRLTAAAEKGDPEYFSAVLGKEQQVSRTATHALDGMFSTVLDKALSMDEATGFHHVLDSFHKNQSVLGERFFTEAFAPEWLGEKFSSQHEYLTSKIAYDDVTYWDLAMQRATAVTANLSKELADAKTEGQKMVAKGKAQAELTQLALSMSNGVLGKMIHDRAIELQADEKSREITGNDQTQANPLADVPVLLSGTDTSDQWKNVQGVVDDIVSANLGRLTIEDGHRHNALVASLVASADSLTNMIATKGLENTYQRDEGEDPLAGGRNGFFERNPYQQQDSEHEGEKESEQKNRERIARAKVMMHGLRSVPSTEVANSIDFYLSKTIKVGTPDGITERKRTINDTMQFTVGKKNAAVIRDIAAEAYVKANVGIYKSKGMSEVAAVDKARRDIANSEVLTDDDLTELVANTMAEQAPEVREEDEATEEDVSDDAVLSQEEADGLAQSMMEMEEARRQEESTGAELSRERGGAREGVDQTVDPNDIPSFETFYRNVAQMVLERSFLSNWEDAKGDISELRDSDLRAWYNENMPQTAPAATPAPVAVPAAAAPATDASDTPMHFPDGFVAGMKFSSKQVEFTHGTNHETTSTGYKFSLPQLPGVNFFVSKNASTKSWNIFEEKSGLGFGSVTMSAKTRVEAIERVVKPMEGKTPRWFYNLNPALTSPAPAASTSAKPDPSVRLMFALRKSGLGSFSNKNQVERLSSIFRADPTPQNAIAAGLGNKASLITFKLSAPDILDVIELPYSMRGQGVGTALVELWENYLKSKGFKNAYVLSGANTVGYWEKLGYKGGTQEDGEWLMMGKSLVPAPAVESSQNGNAPAPAVPATGTIPVANSRADMLANIQAAGKMDDLTQYVEKNAGAIREQKFLANYFGTGREVVGMPKTLDEYKRFWRMNALLKGLGALYEQFRITQKDVVKEGDAKANKEAIAMRFVGTEIPMYVPVTLDGKPVDGDEAIQHVESVLNRLQGRRQTYRSEILGAALIRAFALKTTEAKRTAIIAKIKDVFFQNRPGPYRDPMAIDNASDAVWQTWLFEAKRIGESGKLDPKKDNIAYDRGWGARKGFTQAELDRARKQQYEAVMDRMLSLNLSTFYRYDMDILSLFGYTMTEEVRLKKTPSFGAGVSRDADGNIVRFDDPIMSINKKGEVYRTEDGETAVHHGLLVSYKSKSGEARRKPVPMSLIVSGKVTVDQLIRHNPNVDANLIRNHVTRLMERAPETFKTYVLRQKPTAEQLKKGEPGTEIDQAVVLEDLATPENMRALLLANPSLGTEISKRTAKRFASDVDRVSRVTGSLYNTLAADKGRSANSMITRVGMRLRVVGELLAKVNVVQDAIGYQSVLRRYNGTVPYLDEYTNTIMEMTKRVESWIPQDRLPREASDNISNGFRSPFSPKPVHDTTKTGWHQEGDNREDAYRIDAVVLDTYIQEAQETLFQYERFAGKTRTKAAREALTKLATLRISLMHKINNDSGWRMIENKPKKVEVDAAMPVSEELKTRQAMGGRAAHVSGFGDVGMVERDGRYYLPNAPSAQTVPTGAPSTDAVVNPADAWVPTPAMRKEMEYPQSMKSEDPNRMMRLQQLKWLRAGKVLVNAQGAAVESATELNAPVYLTKVPEWRTPDMVDVRLDDMEDGDKFSIRKYPVSQDDAESFTPGIKYRKPVPRPSDNWLAKDAMLDNVQMPMAMVAAGNKPTGNGTVKVGNHAWDPAIIETIPAADQARVSLQMETYSREVLSGIQGLDDGAQKAFMVLLQRAVKATADRFGLSFADALALRFDENGKPLVYHYGSERQMLLTLQHNPVWKRLSDASKRGLTQTLSSGTLLKAFTFESLMQGEQKENLHTFLMFARGNNRETNTAETLVHEMGHSSFTQMVYALAFETHADPNMAAADMDAYNSITKELGIKESPAELMKRPDFKIITEPVGPLLEKYFSQRQKPSQKTLASPTLYVALRQVFKRLSSLWASIKNLFYLTQDTTISAEAVVAVEQMMGWDPKTRLQEAVRNVVVNNYDDDVASMWKDQFHWDMEEIEQMYAEMEDPGADVEPMDSRDAQESEEDARLRSSMMMMQAWSDMFTGAPQDDGVEVDDSPMAKFIREVDLTMPAFTPEAVGQDMKSVMDKRHENGIRKLMDWLFEKHSNAKTSLMRGWWNAILRHTECLSVIDSQHDMFYMARKTLYKELMDAQHKGALKAMEMVNELVREAEAKSQILGNDGKLTQMTMTGNAFKLIGHYRIIRDMLADIAKHGMYRNAMPLTIHPWVQVLIKKNSGAGEAAGLISATPANLGKVMCLLEKYMKESNAWPTYKHLLDSTTKIMFTEEMALINTGVLPEVHESNPDYFYRFFYSAKDGKLEGAEEDVMEDLSVDMVAKEIASTLSESKAPPPKVSMWKQFMAAFDENQKRRAVAEMDPSFKRVGYTGRQLEKDQESTLPDGSKKTMPAGTIFNPGWPVGNWKTVMTQYLARRWADQYTNQAIYRFVHQYGVTEKELQTASPFKTLATEHPMKMNMDRADWVKLMQQTHSSFDIRALRNLTTGDAPVSNKADDRMIRNALFGVTEDNFAEEMAKVQNDFGLSVSEIAEKVLSREQYQMLSGNEDQMARAIQEALSQAREGADIANLMLLHSNDEQMAVLTEGMTSGQKEAFHNSLVAKETLALQGHIRQRIWSEVTTKLLDLHPIDTGSAMDSVTGGKWYLHNDLIKQLMDFRIKPKDKSAAVNLIELALRPIVKCLLFMNKSRYNFNNQIGDLSFTLQAHPGFATKGLKHYRKAVLHLLSFLENQKVDPEMALAMQTGNIDDGLMKSLMGPGMLDAAMGVLKDGVQELPKDQVKIQYMIGLLKKFAGDIPINEAGEVLEMNSADAIKTWTKLTASMLGSDWGFTKATNDQKWSDVGALHWIASTQAVALVREQSQRLALAYYIKDELTAGRLTPEIAGGASLKHISQWAEANGAMITKDGVSTFSAEAFQNMPAADQWKLACYISGETFGDYSDNGPADRFLKLIMPFWAYRKIDMRRQLHFFQNANYNSPSDQRLQDSSWAYTRAIGKAMMPRVYSHLAFLTMGALWAGVAQGLGGDDERRKQVALLKNMLLDFSERSAMIPFVRLKDWQALVPIRTSQGDTANTLGLLSSVNDMLKTVVHGKPVAYHDKYWVQYAAAELASNAYDWSRSQAGPHIRVGLAGIDWMRHKPYEGASDFNKFSGSLMNLPGGLISKILALGKELGMAPLANKGTVNWGKVGALAQAIPGRYLGVDIKDASLMAANEFKYGVLPVSAIGLTSAEKEAGFPAKRAMLDALYTDDPARARAATMRFMQATKMRGDNINTAMVNAMSTQSPMMRWKFSIGDKTRSPNDYRSDMVRFAEWRSRLNSDEQAALDGAYTVYEKQVRNLAEITGRPGVVRSLLRTTRLKDEVIRLY